MSAYNLSLCQCAVMGEGIHKLKSRICQGARKNRTILGFRVCLICSQCSLISLSLVQKQAVGKSADGGPCLWTQGGHEPVVPQRRLSIHLTANKPH